MSLRSWLEQMLPAPSRSLSILMTARETFCLAEDRDPAGGLKLYKLVL